MNTFVQNINNNDITANGMTAFRTSNSKVLDFFYKAGSSRGLDITDDFIQSYNEDQDLTIRSLLWLRDIRQGAGERDLFRDIFKFMFSNMKYSKHCLDILLKLPELGRWDDLLIVFDITTNNTAMDSLAKNFVSVLFVNAIKNNNGLAAKWAPRQGPIAKYMADLAGLSRRNWRKFVVNATKVVEQQMCARRWDNINYPSVPSQAARIYSKAFARHNPEGYSQYKNSLIRGATKINASVVYPYQIIRDIRNSKDIIIAEEQWKALPNYIGDRRILPLVDTSGSMSCSQYDKSGLTPLDVAISLGLYLSDKNYGVFKDVFMTFSKTPKILRISGSLSEKMVQMKSGEWGYNTNLEAALTEIIEHGKRHNVPENEMPELLLILSDMQFDPKRDNGNPTALQMIREKYENSGYVMPKIVFWNLNGVYKNTPAKTNSEDIVMISGFSPHIMKKILSMGEFNPESLMMDTLMDMRYDYKGEMN